MLSRAEHGQEILITRGKAVAFLGSYRPPIISIPNGVTTALAALIVRTRIQVANA
jgi:hypothetical protein